MSDTIVALATAHGRSGVAVIRLSGEQAFAITQAVTGKPCPSTRGMHMADFHAPSGELIDHGLVLRFVAPHSFTGETVVEWQTHGNPYLIDALVSAAVQHGARVARPGEFSERAFLNGKMGLDQAEALADLIDAGSAQAARAALRSLDGVLSGFVHDVMEQLLQLRMQVEASIDFSDEALSLEGRSLMQQRLHEAQQSIQTLVDRCEAGAQLRDGMQVVILGPPNAGKSSLLNALAMQDRAIVTPHAGTTRDLLESDIHIGGMRLGLMDSAGIRDTNDEVEREGIERALNAAQNADLILAIVPVNEPNAKVVLAEKLPADVPVVWVRSKADLITASDHMNDSNDIVLSAQTGDGLEALRATLSGHDQTTESTSNAFTARKRHIAALVDAGQALEEAIGHWQHEYDELTAEALRQARFALGGIVGQEVPDDLLGAIFSRFCIGK